MDSYERSLGWLRGQLTRSYRYHYEHAPADERSCYTPLLRGMTEYADGVSVPVKDMKVMERAYFKCMDDNPYLFFVDTVTFWTRGEEAGIRIKYKMSREEAGDLLAGMRPIVERIVKACEGKSEAAREQYVHDYLVRNVTYGHDPRFCAHDPTAALIHRRAVCDGISKAAKILFDNLGIRSIVISGDSGSTYDGSDPTGRHAWNLVRIDGAFYHLDITFDNTLTKGSDMIRYDYFNLTEDQIGRDHIYEPLRVVAVRENDYFRARGLYFTRKSTLCHAIQTAVTRRASHFTFRMPFTRDPHTTYDDVAKQIRASLKIGYTIGFNPDQMTVHLKFDY